MQAKAKHLFCLFTDILQLSTGEADASIHPYLMDSNRFSMLEFAPEYYKSTDLVWFHKWPEKYFSSFALVR